MSLFTSIKEAAKAVAAETTRAAKSVAEGTTKAYTDAKATPTTITCGGCNTLLNVPTDLFNWTCPESHENKYADAKCTSCEALQPKKRPEPQVKCANCGVISAVPFTNAEKQIRETARGAKTQYEFLKSKPATFHCSNCNNLLMVPTGPWVCQTCTVSNLQEAEVCATCAQQKADQKVMCGICKRSTKIPSMNIVDAFSKGWRDISNESSKIYYDLRKHPYVTCPRCSTHLLLPLPSATPSTSSDSSTKSSSSSTASSTSSTASSTSSTVSSTSSTSSSAEVSLELEPGAPNFNTLNCTACGMELRYIPPRRRSSASTTTNTSTASTTTSTTTGTGTGTGIEGATQRRTSLTSATATEGATDPATSSTQIHSTISSVPPPS